jgi:hypothetical protein
MFRALLAHLQETLKNNTWYSKKQQTHVLNYTTPLFCVLAPTCFGCKVPSSGSLLDPSELHEIQVELYQVFDVRTAYY